MIEAGILAPGTKLPPERALAEEFSITRVTARQALTRMEAEGLIFREERRGTQVDVNGCTVASGDADIDVVRQHRFTREMSLEPIDD